MPGRRPLAATLLTILAIHGAGAAISAPAAKPWQPPASAAAPKPAPAERHYLPDSTLILRFDDQITTVGDFVAAYFNGFPPDMPPGDSLGRVQFLQAFIDKSVLASLARKVNPPLDFSDRAKLRDQERDVLSNALFQHEIQDRVHVDTTDARDWYRQAATDRHLRLVTFGDSVTAYRMRAAMVSHRMTWTQVYLVAASGHKSPNQGDLGWVTRFDNNDWLDESFYHLKAGEYSQPIPDIGGWNVAQCVETRDAKLVPFHAVVRHILALIRQARTTDRGREVVAVLRKRQKLGYDSLNVVWIAERFAEETQAAAATGGSLSRRVPAIAPEDSGRVLASWPGGRFSVNAFMHAYTAIPPLARPRLDLPVRVQRHVDSIVLENARADYARELGYDKSPDVTAALERKREELMVEHIFQDSIEANVRVTPEMSRRYYDQNLAKFITYPQVDYAVFSCPRKSEGDSLAERLRHGTRAETILREDSLAGRPRRGRLGTVRQSDEGVQYYAELFNEMKPGEVLVNSPDPLGRVLVLQSVRFDPGRQLTYEESAELIDPSVHNLESDRLLRELVARHRVQHRIEWHPELVMQIRWVDPTLDQ